MVGWFDRLFGRGAQQQPAQPAAAMERAPAPTRDGDPQATGNEHLDPIHADRLGDILQVEETRSAEFYVGDLFRRRFRADPPDFPHHFVAVYRGLPAQFRTVGYVHYTQHEDNHLCGGMVIDDRAYRRMPAQHRALIREQGGIAEFMLRETFARLPPSAAIWGYVGDKQARTVDLRAGFTPTEHPYIMVVWRKQFPEAEKAERLQKIAGLGPF